MKEATKERLFQGATWSGAVHFIDFFHPEAADYWKGLLLYYRSQVNFTGLWLDMNEFSNFCQGGCYPGNCPANQTCFDYSKDLPFNPLGSHNIEAQSVALNASSFGGEYGHLHGLMSVLQQKASR